MSIIKDFTFNGRTASSFGVQLADNSEWWATPERDIEHISVPGRSGDLLIDNGRFNNLEITFEVNRLTDGRALSSLINWLALNPGYQRLSVSDDPGHYRMASFEGMTQPTFGQLKKSATVSLAFNCKPQRFIISDEEGVTIRRGTPLTFTNYGDLAKPAFVFLHDNAGDNDCLDMSVVDTAYPNDALTYRAKFSSEEPQDPDWPVRFDIDTESMELYGTMPDGRTDSTNLLEITGWAEHFGKQEPFLELQHGHEYTITIDPANRNYGWAVTAMLRRWEL